MFRETPPAHEVLAHFSHTTSYNDKTDWLLEALQSPRAERRRDHPAMHPAASNEQYISLKGNYNNKRQQPPPVRHPRQTYPSA